MTLAMAEPYRCPAPSGVQLGLFPSRPLPLSPCRDDPRSRINTRITRPDTSLPHRRQQDDDRRLRIRVLDDHPTLPVRHVPRYPRAWVQHLENDVTVFRHYSPPNRHATRTACPILDRRLLGNITSLSLVDCIILYTEIMLSVKVTAARKHPLHLPVAYGTIGLSRPEETRSIPTHQRISPNLPFLPYRPLAGGDPPPAGAFPRPIETRPWQANTRIAPLLREL
jgi:hypothetical protein